jgi:hypothetical protein
VRLINLARVPGIRKLYTGADDEAFQVYIADNMLKAHISDYDSLDDVIKSMNYYCDQHNNSAEAAVDAYIDDVSVPDEHVVVVDPDSEEVWYYRPEDTYFVGELDNVIDHAIEYYDDDAIDQDRFIQCVVTIVHN